MRVAITGGNGDLGREMQATAPATYKVRVLDQKVQTKDANDDCRQVDVLDLPALTEALRGVDAVIHLAAIRNPFVAPHERVFEVNAQGSYHITLACEKLGIQTLVYASSICYYGYLFRAKLAPPPYFPIDEETPDHPEDSYSLSKRVGEEIMKAYVQRTGGAVASLRYAYMLPGGATGEPLAKDSARDMAANESSAKSWWTYVDIRDAAKVTWQALATITGRHDFYDAYNIGADDTHALTPTVELIHAFYPSSELHYNPPLNPASTIALYSNARARRMLGFQPTSPSWRAHAKELKEIS